MIKMNKIYRFSPIKTKDELFDAINYVATKTIELRKKVTSKVYPTKLLTIYSHYPNEFENLKSMLFKLGSFDKEVNGPYVKLFDPIQLPNNKLEFLRIREPDPYRMQVGCSDVVVPDFEGFKKEYLAKYSNSLRLLKRPERDILEFFDPDFDVLAYVLSS